MRKAASWVNELRRAGLVLVWLFFCCFFGVGCMGDCFLVFFVVLEDGVCMGD